MRKTAIDPGFTLIEIVISIGIILVFFGLGWVNFTTLPSRATLLTDSVSLINEIKAQQMLSMTGDTQGGTLSNYGIHFESTSYTIFKGDNYVPGASGNFVTELGNANLNFTNITFPENKIVFEKGSGEIAGFTLGNDSITINDSQTGASKVIRFNKYGATY